MNIRNYICKTLLGLFLLVVTNAHATIHEFETTHMKSMAGAGVGGVLAEESAFLNPAGLAFFATSAFYAQKDTAKLTVNDVSQKAPRHYGFVIADGNPSLSGSISYTEQKEDVFQRQRWGLTLSSPISEHSAFGISVRKSKDQNTSLLTTTKYYQSVIGITHAIDEKASLGIVAYDPFKSRGHETKALFGVQYLLFSYITTSIDLGGDYTADHISDTLIVKGALQIRVLDDFYVRMGSFNDKIRREHGSGYGLAWVQPRLSFEFGIKDYSRKEDLARSISKASIKESSLSASMRF